jgi:alpha-tubulin suppressor-like RCC1 family protein
VFSFGWNYNGQLGHGDTRDRLEPTNIKSLALIKALKKKRFVQVCAGSEHSVVLSGICLVYEPANSRR